MNENVPSIDLTYSIPKDFKNKIVNEPFMQKIMAVVLSNEGWQQGKPERQEPDRLHNGDYYEFTIASNSKKKNNFIQTFLGGRYSSDDIERDSLNYIIERIRAKASKRYSVDNVNLCILCLLDLTNWVLDYYNSYTYVLFDDQRRQFFADIREEYINKGPFTNIYILFPDCSAKWWIYNVLTEERKFYQVTDEEIKNRTVPFVCINRLYGRYATDT